MRIEDVINIFNNILKTSRDSLNLDEKSICVCHRQVVPQKIPAIKKYVLEIKYVSKEGNFIVFSDSITRNSTTEEIEEHTWEQLDKSAVDALLRLCLGNERSQYINDMITGKFQGYGNRS